MSSARPLVTIGMPTYNRATLVGQSIESALAQSYGNVEVLISDNASSDGTADVCARHAARDRRVRLVRQPQNRGPTANFEYVLRNARGELFMWLGDDDWIDANYVEACARVLAARSDVVIAAGIPNYYRGDTFAYTGTIMNLLEETGPERVRSYYADVRHNSIFYGLMRTSQIAGIAVRNVLGGDQLQMAAMAFLGKVVTVHDTRLHRRRGGDSTNNKKLVAAMSLNWLDARLPRVSVVRNIFLDIVRDGSVYRGLPAGARLHLAVDCVTRTFLRKVRGLLRGSGNRE